MALDSDRYAALLHNPCRLAAFRHSGPQFWGSYVLVSLYLQYQGTFLIMCTLPSWLHQAQFSSMCSPSEIQAESYVLEQESVHVVDVLVHIYTRNI